MEQITIENILEMVNNKEMSLEEVGKIVGKSKSTVQRMLVKEGYSFNKKSGKYETTNDDNNKTINEVNDKNYKEVKEMEQQINETSNNDNNKKTNEELISRTYTIPKKLERALKIKAAVEEKEAVEIVREALKAIIEDKYFNF